MPVTCSLANVLPELDPGSPLDPEDDDEELVEPPELEPPESAGASLPQATRAAAVSARAIEERARNRSTRRV